MCQHHFSWAKISIFIPAIACRSRVRINLLLSNDVYTKYSFSVWCAPNYICATIFLFLEVNLRRTLQRRVGRSTSTVVWALLAMQLKNLPKSKSDNWMSAWGSICAAMTAQAAHDTGIYLLNMT